MSRCENMRQCPTCKGQQKARWKHGEMFCLRCLKKMTPLNNETPALCEDCEKFAQRVESEFLQDSIAAAIAAAKGEV